MAKLSPQQRLSRWKSLLLKVLMVFQVFQTKQKAMTMLGKEVYLRVFQEAKKVENKKDEDKQITKVINGEIVGKQLESMGKGKRAEKATEDPMTCVHPTDKMKREGNKSQKTWCCLLCLTRWERLPLETVNLKTEGKDNDLVTFGKYLGKTYKEVASDPEQTQWILQSVEQDPKVSQEMIRLANYLVAKESKWEPVEVKKEMDVDIISIDSQSEGDL